MRRGIIQSRPYATISETKMTTMKNEMQSSAIGFWDKDCILGQAYLGCPCGTGSGALEGAYRESGGSSWQIGIDYSTMVS